ncbi:MAG TPA: hypothetical protein VNT02_10000 [Burkholderiales bacterium]|nr:hypothetical protein [Burkholderiales bacterium]
MMPYSLSALLMHGREAARPRWRFEVDRSHAPVRVAWRWEQSFANGVSRKSGEAFATFAECARDAQAHGFTTREPYVLSDSPIVPASAWARPLRASEAAPGGDARDG